MNTPSTPTFACRYCQHYSPEGRRGGHCQQLGAPVRGEWTACSLMIPSFTCALEGLSIDPQPDPVVTYRRETKPTRRILSKTS